MPESSRRRRERRSRHAPGRGRGWGDPGAERPSGDDRPRIRPRTWKKTRRWLIYGASVVAAAAVIGGIVASSFAGTGGGGGDAQTGTGADVGQRVSLLDRTHIPEGDPFTRYNSIPPASGPHWATGWARCEIYDNEDEVPDPRIVHNLEHGQIVISHNLKDEAEIERLKDIARDLPSRRSWMIMRPYSRLNEGEVALTAWGWLDRFQSVDEERVREFYDAHVNNGPESISCLRGG